jgi:hypothetical protein
VEEPKTHILGSALRNRHRLAMFRNPPGDALSYPQLQPVNHFVLVRILGSPQNQFVFFAQVNEAGVTFHYRGNEFDDLFEILMKGISRGHAAAYIMQKIDIYVAVGNICTHGLKYRPTAVMSNCSF